MNPAPMEYRILTALLLAPMASREIAAALSTAPRIVWQRLDYLCSAGQVHMHGHVDGKGVPVRFALTRQGRAWAQELVA